MCLAIPGKVEEISADGIIRMGRVNFGGVVKNVCLDYVPEVQVGDYTIVHVGFAISKIDEATAEQTLADFRALGVLDDELAGEEEAFARAARAPQSNCPDGSCNSANSAGAPGPSHLGTGDSMNPANSANPADSKP
ncbi:MAG: HypC/HybG/HupF family hydrogenase formation chaperone [Terracidiphilus sp.]|jgi:hydrogenase expression/formation protein HypC